MEYEEFKKRMWELVKRKLREILTAQLRFANVDDVIKLCWHQLEWNEFSRETLEGLLAKMPDDPKSREVWLDHQAARVAEGAASARYVEDAERVAEYRARSTTNARREQILWHYRFGYEPFLIFSLQTMLTDRFARQEGETRLAEAQTKVEEKVFDNGQFNKAVSGYKPASGGSFQCYFQQRIVWRCCDVVDELDEQVRFVEDPPPVESLNICPDAEEAARRRAILLDCMNRLQREKQPNVPLWGIEARAAFELRHTIYIDPQDYGDTTNELITDFQGEDVLSDLAREYHEACDRLTEHQKKLGITEHDVRHSYATLCHYRFLLENSGHSAGDIVRLEGYARDKNIGDLEKELNSMMATADSSRSDKLRSRREKTTFMIAFVRLRAAEKRRIDELKIADDWKSCRGQWVRAEKTVGELIGISQTTVHHRLTAARSFLRTCLKQNG